MPAQLKEVADVLSREQSRGAVSCASMTQFMGAAFHQAAGAEVASRFLLELFGNKREALVSFVRVVDVAAELQQGSSVLAVEMIRLWDTPREEHKLARLADELIQVPEHYTSEVALLFMPALARRLAFSHAELSMRLLKLASVSANETTQGEIATARIWIKAGEFLRTQTESVRFFWHRHLRQPFHDDEWNRMNARAAVEAIRVAQGDESVLAMLRGTIPAEVWEGTAKPAAPAAKSSAPALVVPKQMGQPTITVSTVSQTGTPIAKPGASLRAACASSVKSAEGNATGSDCVAFSRAARLFASLAILGGVGWLVVPSRLMTKKVHVAATKAVVVVEQSKPVAQAAKTTERVATSQVLVSKVSAPALNDAKMMVPASTARIVLPVQAKTPPMLVQPKPVETSVSSVATLALPGAMSFAQPVENYSGNRAPMRNSVPTRAKSATAPVPVKMPNSSVASTLPAPPVEPLESIAKPLQLTQYDRWALSQTRDLSSEYPELFEMQQAVVKGTWTDRIMRVDGVRPITADPERYVVLLRWLVIDPPLPEATRQIVLRAWSKAVSPDECIALWCQLVKARAGHSADIARAATEMLGRAELNLNASQQLKLHELAAGEVTD